MKSLICLLISFGIAYGLSLPLKPNCLAVFCTMDLKICPDGTPAPVPAGGCCPSLSACKSQPIVAPALPTYCAVAICTADIKICPDGTFAPIPAGQCCPSLSACKSKPIVAPALPAYCAATMCTMDIKICPDGTFAPIPAGQCCPSLSACRPLAASSRNNPLGSLGSLLSGNNLLQTLSGATQGTDIGTVLSILNLLNNVQQLSNDIHQIPTVINQTLASILNTTGQASQIIIDQLISAVTNNNQHASRDLLGALGQNANLLSSIGHILPQGTSISTIISILNLLNNINALTNDIHQIPVVLNQTLSTLVDGAGQAGQIVLQQLLGLLGNNTATSRDLLGALGQNANLLSSIGHILPQGTSISTIISILNLLNNINALTNDIHQIPVVLNQTLSTLVAGAGQAGQIVVQQLLDLVGIHSQAASRDLLSTLGQSGNLLSTISHLLPQGTSISTVLSLLNLLSNVNALNNDIHQIPAVLQETLQNILNGVQNLLPPTLQPVQGSS